ncbi:MULTISPECIES: hypothetical protein [unclassified Clostridium]|uniref:hypothetical protein n=1 Tax=unclassified Clostridium TaxID=2614128 RepID=UPI0025BAD112|nr:MULTISPECIES: hypothetical protein [unclassified Clostridium]
MKVSIWIINLENKPFEVSNTAQSVIDIGNSVTSENYGFLQFGYCKEHDLIQYDVTQKAFNETTLKVIHRGNSEDEIKFVLDFIKNKVHEKSDLMHEIQVLKKIKFKEIQPLIDEIKANVHKNYFQFKIADILKEYKVS